MVLALVVAVWSPVAGLVVLAGGSTIASLSMAYLGPAERKNRF
jgi:hypothetical protein